MYNKILWMFGNEHLILVYVIDSEMIRKLLISFQLNVNEINYSLYFDNISKCIFKS